MRPALLCLIVAACGSDKPSALPPKPPNTELIVGEFERRPPVGTTAIRFRADGSVAVAHDKTELDSKPAAQGSWTLDGDKLTFTNERGLCADAPGTRVGVYQVVISKVGIHFKKLEDRCDRRSTIDGQTWWRIK